MAQKKATVSPATPAPTALPTIKTGPPVTGADFFGREAEVKKLWAKLEGGHNLLIVSPRRIGKTSVMRDLEANPHPGWAPVFTNLEGKNSAASVIMEVVQHLEKRGGTGEKVAGFFKKAFGTVEEFNAFNVGLKLSKTNEQWDRLSLEFEAAIAKGASPTDRLLLIVDEFPIVIEELFSTPETKQQALNLLQLFRKIRTNTAIKDRFRMIIGGSIGLKPVLRRNKATADANDLKAFRLGPWSKTTALAFMKKIAESHGLALRPAIRSEVLKRTGEQPIPFHLQVMLDGLIELEKPGAKIDADDVEQVWQEKLGDVDLDHYKERLSSVLEPDEAAAAQDMLDRLAQAGPQSRQALHDLIAKPRVVGAALRVLVEDGYCVEKKIDGAPGVAFANPMIEAFWQKHCL